MLFGEPFGGVLPGARGAVLAVLLRTDAQLTGRQVHGLASGGYSLWSVQAALKELVELGLVESQAIGRAGVHTINEDHVAVAPLRALVDPIAALKTVIRDAIDTNVSAVILFGSIARGDATADSDIDLAVIARRDWGGRVGLQEAVRSSLGNACDVLLFTEPGFKKQASAREPVVLDIVRDGVALFGMAPRVRRGVA